MPRKLPEIEDSDLATDVVAAFLALLAVLTLFFWVIPAYEGDASADVRVEEDDMVAFHVSGYLEDGRMFLTTERGLALDDSVEKSYGFTINPTKDSAGLPIYLPFEIKIGDIARYGLPERFDDNLLGSRVGDRLTFTLTSAQAYGSADVDDIWTIDSEVSLDATQTTGITEFIGDYGAEPVPGLTGTHVKWDMPFEVTGVKESIVTYELIPQKGDILSTRGCNDLKCEFDSSVSYIDTTANEGVGVIIIEHLATPGDLVDNGAGVVTNVTASEITVDFNDERAGDDITFDVTILQIRNV